MSGNTLRKRRKPFVQIPSSTIRDERLSFMARGLLAYLLDLPDGWDVRSENIAAATPPKNGEGRDVIRRKLVHELGQYGYYRLERRKMRDGTFEMGTAISEEPVPSWIEEYAEFGGKAVPVIEQPDGTFKVRRADGTLTDDGFDIPLPPEPPNLDMEDDPDDWVPDDTGAWDSGAGEPGAGTTGAWNPGAGFPGAGNPVAGFPGSGDSGAFSKTEKEDRDTDDVPPSSVRRAPQAERDDETLRYEFEQHDRDTASGGVRQVSAKPARKKDGEAKRGTRIPDDFAVTDDMRAWAAKTVPGVDIAFETDQFIDHFKAAPGSKGVKLDWTRTWQRWMREEYKRLPDWRRRLADVPAEIAATAERAVTWWFGECRERNLVVDQVRDRTRLRTMIIPALLDEDGKPLPDQEEARRKIAAALTACGDVVPGENVFRRALAGEPPRSNQRPAGGQRGNRPTNLLTTSNTGAGLAEAFS